MNVVVRIDPTRCRGHAICALFYPEGIELDRWGYGRVVDPTPGDSRSLKRALRAVAACPNDAVVVDQRNDTAGGPFGGMTPGGAGNAGESPP